METKDIIFELRTKRGLSQEGLAEKIFVTRQAVSRWETGETVPNTETLKLLSQLFDVSINTLLGSPRQLICQCCGMPLEDSDISRESDGFFNEEYCKWCYADGEYMYHNMDDLIEVCVAHMANEAFPPEKVRAYMKEMLPKLDYWKRYKTLMVRKNSRSSRQNWLKKSTLLGLKECRRLKSLTRSWVDTLTLNTVSQTVKA